MNTIAAPIYAQSFGIHQQVVNTAIISKRNPNSSDNFYLIGQRWINTNFNSVFSLISYTYENLLAIPNWSRLSAGAFNITAAGITPALSGGVLVVPTASATASSQVIISRFNIAGSVGTYTVTTGTGNFSINPSNPSDASTFFYAVIN